LTGIILAGGKNSRMGVKKAFLHIGETTIIESILAVYKKIFSETIIVTNTPEDYKHCNVNLVEDIIQNRGPLGGIYTGLIKAKNEYCFVTACDMPFINESVISYISSIRGYDIVVPVVRGQHEPLFALYSKKCVAVLREQLQSGNLCVKDIFKSCSVKEVLVEDLWKNHSALISFTNVNTPEEFKNALMLRKNEQV
jgi:molybdenum cofactor guanylyltransferase